MVAPELRRTHLALPLGLVGFAGAWFVADFYRFDLAGNDEKGRGVLTLAIPLVSAALGALISSRRISRAAWLTWVAVVMGTMLGGMAIGGITSIVAAGRGRFDDGVGLGLATAAVFFLPVVVAVTAASRRVGRARAFTLVDAIDRRGAWTITATVISGGRLVALIGDPFPMFQTARRMDHVLTAFVLLAGTAVVCLFLADLGAVASVRRAARSAAEMQRRDPETALPCDDVEDLGLGDEEREEVCGGPAYRSTARPLRVLKGSVDLARRAARNATLRSALCLGLTMAALMLSLVVR